MPHDKDKDSAGASAIADLVKRRTTALQGFSRVANSLSNILKEPCSISALQKMLDDIEERYRVLEERCEEIFNSADEEDAIYQETEKILQDKYFILNKARSEVSSRIAEPVMKEAAEAAATTTAAQAELVRSFKASLTLPKPEFRKFDGDPGQYSAFISYVESYVEENVDDVRQCLSFVIDSCTGVAYDAVSFLSQCQNAQTAYQDAKKILKDLFGGKHQIVRSVLENCTNGPQIRANDVEGLRGIVISLKKAVVTLKEYKASEELYSTDKLVKIYHRLPKPLQHKWNEKVVDLQDKGYRPDFSNMQTVIEAYIRSTDNSEV